MALFGLLAANASWNLLNNEGTNFFAGQSIAEQSVLASKNTKALDKTPMATASVVSASTLQTNLNVNKDNKNYKAFASLKTMAQKDDKASVTNVANKGYYEVTINDLEALDNYETYSKLIKRDDLAKDGIEIIENTNKFGSAHKVTYRMRYDKIGFEKNLIINGKKAGATLQVAGYEYDTDQNVHNTIYKTTYKIEGSAGEECENGCEKTVTIKMGNGEDLAAQLISFVEDSEKKSKKVAAKKKKIAEERLCKAKKHKRNSDKKIACLIASYEGKRELKNQNDLTEDELDKIITDLSQVLTTEYMEDPKSREFRDALKGNKKSNALAKKIRKEAREEIATQERIENEEERTEKLSKQFRKEMRYFQKASRVLDKRTRVMESTISKAKRDIQKMEMSCDPNSGIYGNNNGGRDYFGGAAGFTFDFKDGFQTWSSQNSKRNLLTQPSTNGIGGQAQWNQQQAQWDRINRQNQQMLREWCMKDVATAKNYWNWEVANYEDTKIAPIRSDLENRLNQLDMNRIFPTTYKSESKYNGGLHRDDFEVFAEQVHAFRTDLQNMGVDSQNNSDLLYNNSPRSNRDSIYNRNTNSNPGSYNSNPVRGRGASRG